MHPVLCLRSRLSPHTRPRKNKSSVLFLSPLSRLCNTSLICSNVAQSRPSFSVHVAVYLARPHRSVRSLSLSATLRPTLPHITLAPRRQFMGPRPQSPRLEHQSYLFPSSSSPSSSASTATPSRISFESPLPRDKSSSSTLTPARRLAAFKLRSASSRATGRHDSDSDGSNTETKQGRLSPQLHIRRKFPRRQSERALTLPSSRTTPFDLVHPKPSTSSGRPLSHRSSSASSSSSSGGTSWKAHPPSTSSGIGRKVAASLDLFKESATTPNKEEDNPFESGRSASSVSRHRSSSFQQLNDVGEPQFEFVKRSDWPDREAAAIRREKSTTTLERVRTRDSLSSTRGEEGRRKKERQPSVRDSVLNDLVQWRKVVAAHQDDGRGRPRERPLWPEEGPEEAFVGSPGSDASLSSSVSSSATYQDKNDRTVPSSPYRRPQSRSQLSLHDQDEDLSLIFPASSHFVRSPEHAVPPPASMSRTRSRSSSPRPTSPLPLTAQPVHQPTSLIPPPSFISPWSSDEDDESAWETASVTTTTSTTSASSPFPLSPSRTSPVPQPLVRHPSDEDDEHHSGPLSRFHDLDLGQGPNGVSQGIPTDWSFNLSQESLPHIPLRPFRNQVGGHSAIYKFTKRAVCKVRRMWWYECELC